AAGPEGEAHGAAAPEGNSARDRGGLLSRPEPSHRADQVRQRRAPDRALGLGDRARGDEGRQVKRSGANPVAWLEGMFLRPQHLQQQAEYVRDRIHHQMRSVDPFHWGVRGLVIDEDALSDRRIDIRALEIVLPDGLWIRYPESATIEIRDFAPSSEPIDVWVALPLGRPGEPDAAHEDENKRSARYQIRTESLVDQHRGGQPASVDLLVPNLRLFLSGEDLDLEQHESLRIARIVSTGQKARPFALATDFAPPMLALQACPWLTEE